jgi:hypothetical protein
LGSGGVCQAVQEISMPSSEAQDSGGYLSGEGGVCHVKLAFVWHSICLWLWLIFIPYHPVVDEYLLYLHCSHKREVGREVVSGSVVANLVRRSASSLPGMSV